ncbi:FAD-dependent oxidoreductase [Actinospica sp. MGRD01-02]|uniref:FAD-dependent oxidoreductase n=1 Tax=Actinospica acidithermotolerans TaxID=2828514 RepID=A0A941E6H2_9ACTN|nr:FAD-dependent oxidoreductase [Actinospica acidithermotolerans]MBR7826011.1 FAD-dependent oxidoreductase [Actinospica acidithermotolerans]
MRTAVIGAGPAGLTSAKQALERGHEVVLYERTAGIGGIWNPASGGAYASVRMQSSRMSFPFSDFAPSFAADFPTLAEMHNYLCSYAREFGVTAVSRFEQTVIAAVREAEGWAVTARAADGTTGTEHFDAVLVASGELWESRVPDRLPDAGCGVRVLTAKQYRGPEPFAGERVLVVGGGVSGADIAAELASTAADVQWSVRRNALFLPRVFDGVYNDAIFSYIGRIGMEEMPFAEFLKLLDEAMPEYFAMYRKTGLLPADGFHGAVHVNERIVPAVYRGEVTVRGAFESFDDDGTVHFTDGSTQRYDSVVLCLGYGMPDYSFLPALRREELYEHFFPLGQPGLAIINTPVDTEAFGTACPYFEAIAAWALRVLDGELTLPDEQERAAWCAREMSRLADRRYYDCWLETIRLGLLAGTIPDPAHEFRSYWTLVSSQVDPANLRPVPARPLAATFDHRVDLDGLRHRVLAALPAETRTALREAGEISAADCAAAEATPAGREIEPWLPYRQRVTPSGAPAVTADVG